MSIASLARRCFQLLALALVLPAWIAQPAAAQGSQEIRSLQQRLTDAKCYSGPLDGVSNSSLGDAARRCPDTEPVLSIETGMHLSTVRSVGVDRDCRLAVTGSDDKTVRLWSLADGKLVRTMRPPIGRGDLGKVYATELSPDGKTIAVGGWDAYYQQKSSSGVYLFDTATGAMTARLGNFDGGVVFHLAFSPDGRYLLVNLSGGMGMRVLDLRSGAEIAADKEYTRHSIGGAFAPDGRLYTVAYDGYLRAYDRNFKLVKKIRTIGGQEPFGVSVDESGQNLAVGFNDTKAVDVYRASDLEFAFTADTSGSEIGNISAVTWWKGNRLAAGGTLRRPGTFPIYVWEDGGRGNRSEVNVANATIMDLTPCGDGFAAATADPSWAQVDGDGRIASSMSGATIDMRIKLGDAFQVSSDGTQVRFGTEIGGGQPALFDLAKGTLTPGAPGDGLAKPKVDGINLTGWRDTLHPKLDGKPIALADYEMSRALAATPDTSMFVLGSEWAIRAIDRSGQELWKKPTPGIAWGVNVTGDGRMVVVAYGDGTIRWHRMSDGQQLMALFVDKQDMRWVAWTPSGYYQASTGGDDLFGWHINRGWDQGADFFTASRFRNRFSRPDIVQQVLVTLDEATAIEQANRQAHIATDTSSVASRLPPVVRLLSPSPESTINGNEVTIEYELRSPSGLPVDAIEVQFDGRPARGFLRPDPAMVSAKVERRTLAIPARDVQIGLVARSGALASEVASVPLKWAGAAPPHSGEPPKPKLYGVVVGVSTYKDPSINLHYAAKDARDFAVALYAQKGGMYRDVELKVFTDADATMPEVKKALTWLEKSVTSRDTGLVFLAGHGITDARNRFYYLTSDADTDQAEDTALEGVILRDRTRAIAGRALIFLDTCHAGQAMSDGDINAVINALSGSDNGVVTYASSTGRQLSVENDAWQNGAFTKALVEGLPAAGRKGRADFTNTGVISSSALDLWLTGRVRELTNGAQSPVMGRPPTIADFPLFAEVK